MSKKTSFLDRMTDPSQYTGSHQHRFDANGNGLGLAGRDRIAKGAGTADTPYTGGAIADISQITRTNLRHAGPTLADRPPVQSSSAALAAAAPSSKKKPKKCIEADCVNKASPTSEFGYCSYHVAANSEKGQYPTSDAPRRTHRRIPTGER